MAATIDVGTVAEYARDETWGDLAGSILTGDVVKVGKTYADIAWRNGRTERVHFRDKREMSGITFQAETAEQVAAVRREHFDASLPFLPRQTEQRRIELEHDDRADLVHQGQRTSRWYRTVTATLRARTVEIDRMVAALRPGDQVRQTDDPNGTVWTIRDIRDGNDGWVWLGLRRTPENDTEVWDGCRARGVDLVASATDDEYVAAVEAQLHEDHQHGWLTDDEYAASLERIRSHATESVGRSGSPTRYVATSTANTDLSASSGTTDTERQLRTPLPRIRRVTDMRTALTEHIRSLHPQFDETAEVVANEVAAFVRVNGRELAGYRLSAAREEELREFVYATLTRTSLYASSLAGLVVAEFKLARLGPDW